MVRRAGSRARREPVPKTDGRSRRFLTEFTSPRLSFAVQLDTRGDKALHARTSSHTQRVCTCANRDAASRDAGSAAPESTPGTLNRTRKGHPRKPFPPRHASACAFIAPHTNSFTSGKRIEGIRLPLVRSPTASPRAHVYRPRLRHVRSVDTRRHPPSSHRPSLPRSGAHRTRTCRPRLTRGPGPRVPSPGPARRAGPASRRPRRPAPCSGSA
jgi:hypothetical protein